VADDLMRMQRQGALRVQQMQDHSRRVFEAHQGRPPTPLGDDPWRESLQSPGLYARKEMEVCPPPPAPPPVKKTEDWDGEQWLLLGLAALLWRCGCRTELLLAVLYLAL